MSHIVYMLKRFECLIESLFYSMFADMNNKATDEIWYKRAVDYHKVNKKAFVYSIPFDVGTRKTKVTATHAIMVGRGSQETPAAVAGMQIDYDIFREMFFNETNKVSFGLNGIRNMGFI